MDMSTIYMVMSGIGIVALGILIPVFPSVFMAWKLAMGRGKKALIVKCTKNGGIIFEADNPTAIKYDKNEMVGQPITETPKHYSPTFKAPVIFSVQGRLSPDDLMRFFENHKVIGKALDNNPELKEKLITAIGEVPIDEKDNSIIDYIYNLDLNKEFPRERNEEFLNNLAPAMHQAGVLEGMGNVDKMKKGDNTMKFIAIATLIAAAVTAYLVYKQGDILGALQTSINNLATAIKSGTVIGK